MVESRAVRPGEGMLPQNIEAEQAVLGSLLIDPRAVERIASFLRPDDFYLPVNAEIYRGMLVLYERDMPSDIVTLSDHLEAQGRLDDMGGAAYLASLATIVPTSINVEHYARIVERLAVLRRLVDAGNRISAIGYDERLEADAALEEAERVLFEISRLRVTRDFQPLASILAEVYEKIDHIHSHESEVTGIPTGFIDLDRLTSGFQRSDLIILAARPSQGKTALALNVAHSVAIKSGLPVGIFSVEMSGEQLAHRLISLQSQVDSQKLRSGRMSDSDWDRLVQAVGILSEAPIFVDDTPALSTVEMRSKSRRLHSEQGLGLIIVDYLQLMQGASSENRVQEISAISRGLKAVARELDVPVLALSQLSRAPEQRPNHEPMLSDLRESGCLAGETLVYLPLQGLYRRIDELVGARDLIVEAVDPSAWRLRLCPVTRVFATGYKPIFRLTTRAGRTVRATSNHKFLTVDGWKRLDCLSAGSRVAVPRRATAQLGFVHHPSGLRRDRSSVSVRPRASVGEGLSPQPEDGGLKPSPTTLNHNAWSWRERPGGQRRSYRSLRRIATPAGDGNDSRIIMATRHPDGHCAPNLMETLIPPAARESLAHGSVSWDEIVSIDPDGEERVYDLTVEGLHNFVANDIIVHNSIEQDADVVMFIYRDVVYNKETERPHVADVLVAKHRNGPTGKIHLFFQESLMKFLDLSAHGDD